MATRPVSSRFLLIAAVLAVSAALLLACGSSGRSLRDPKPGATAPPRKESAAGTLTPSSSMGVGEGVFGLASTAWTPGGEIPKKFTCDGEDLSPPIAVFAPPAGTVELALVATDTAAPFVHWVMAGMAPTSTVIEAGQVPPGAVQANNTAGAAQYTGPCPPVGEEHTYDFTVYALPAPSGVTTGQDAVSAVAAIIQQPIQTASITGFYGR
jgi:Raf kinase inhibitor-like YbhB/YbcL family protein